jgi:hypothetical protein
MNRSILIVICDFLLVSLLAFSTVDINNIATDGSNRTVSTTLSSNQADTTKDLTAVMRVALDEERRGRDKLIGELAQTRAARDQETRELQQELSSRERQAQQLQREVTAREEQGKALEAKLQAREAQGALLQQQVQNRDEEARRLQEQQAALLRQFLAAQTNIQALNQQLQAASTDSVMSKERLAAMEADMKKQTEQAAAMQQQMNSLSMSNQVVLNEKQRLSTQLQIAEVETRNAKDQVVRMQDEVKIERDERQKLTEGIHALAAKQGELATEVRVTRPMVPNTIFNDFVTNRIRALFSATRFGWLGNESTRRTETSSVLVTDGTNTFAMCHVEDTPLSFGYPGVDWEQLIGTLGRSGAIYPIRSISFYLQDPRIVLIPVTAAEAKALGGKIYSISADPYKFQDAVIIGTRESYYGECSFQIDVARQKDYVLMDHNSLKGLFGKFNPSRGDLVFSKAGELLGVMANNSYCVMIHSFDSAATFRFGQNVPQHTGEVLSQLYSVVAQLPSKLQ